ncbi:hypothetical protein BDZ97DRAFT_1853121 [Flammula alnicola]|nr:hypothetical protein BDZ97DRAFT_1853121 [Flammula alnicola]
MSDWCAFSGTSRRDFLVFDDLAYARKFLPQHAPEILAHAVKHNYPRLITATLPHFARAALVPVLEKLPPAYMIPWARYHEAWRLLFKEVAQYIWNRQFTSSSSCHSSGRHSAEDVICKTCVDSLHVLIRHLEEIDTLATLQETLQSPNTKYKKSVRTCCRQSGYDSREYNCPFVDDVTKLCQNKIDKLPSFATLLGLKV